MSLSRKQVERARSSINTSLSPTDLAARVQTNLDVVRDAYDTTSIALTELSKALSRIDSIATQEGSAAAVKAFRDIAAAQKDIASTIIALRAEGRTTIRETLAAEVTEPSPPPAPLGGGEGSVPQPAQEFSPTREANILDSEIEIDSDSAPAANNHDHSEISLKKDGAPDGAPPLRPSPLSTFLKANRSPK